MQDTKKWWQSKTIWGILISGFVKTYLALRLLLKFSGIDLPALPEGFEQTLQDVIITTVGFIGDILAIIGRIKATTKIE